MFEDDIFAILNGTLEEKGLVAESLKPIDNIGLLDDKKEQENDFRTSSKVLEEYTDLDSKAEDIERQIEELKASNPEIFKKLEELDKNKADLLNKQTELKDELTSTMKAEGLPKLEGTKYKVTFVAETTRSNFDRKSFEAKYPVLCKQFIKESPVSAYVKITEVK